MTDQKEDKEKILEEQIDRIKGAKSIDELMGVLGDIGFTVVDRQKDPLFYLSFANEERFLGGAVVRATNFIEAVKVAHALGINPGGEVCGLEVPKEFDVPEKYIGCLLTKEEVSQMGEETGAGPGVNPEEYDPCAN